MERSIISLSLLILMTSFNSCANSSQESDNTKIDLSNYFEKSNHTKNMIYLYENTRTEEYNEDYYDETVTVNNNTISYARNANNANLVTINEQDLNITLPEEARSYLLTRYAHVGDEISSYSSSYSTSINERKYQINLTEKCTLARTLTAFTLDPEGANILYEGDIIQQQCIQEKTQSYLDKNETYQETDITYTYYQKNKGLIATVDKNCWIENQNNNPDNNTTILGINDNRKQCFTRTIEQTFLLE